MSCTCCQVKGECRDCMADKLMPGGIKHDSGKVIMSELLNSKAYDAVSVVLHKGGQKYERGNWRNGFSEDRLFDAVIGHIKEHMKGNIFDEEFGTPHLAHAIAGLVFLMEQMDLPDYGRNYDNSKDFFEKDWSSDNDEEAFKDL